MNRFSNPRLMVRICLLLGPAYMVINKLFITNALLMMMPWTDSVRLQGAIRRSRPTESVPHVVVVVVEWRSEDDAIEGGFSFIIILLLRSMKR